MFRSSFAGFGFGGVFTILMVLATRWDLKHRRIPNRLVVATVALGAAFQVMTLGATRGAVVAVEGAAVGLALWLPWWWFGMMGAGDVKFFAAAAAWLGPRGALGAAILTALLGGLLGVAWLLKGALERRRGDAIPPTGDEDAVERPVRSVLPYGVAMALGLGVAAWVRLIR